MNLILDIYEGSLCICFYEFSWRLLLGELPHHVDELLLCDLIRIVVVAEVLLQNLVVFLSCQQFVLLQGVGQLIGVKHVVFVHIILVKQQSKIDAVLAGLSSKWLYYVFDAQIEALLYHGSIECCQELLLADVALVTLVEVLENVRHF